MPARGVPWALVLLLLWATPPAMAAQSPGALPSGDEIPRVEEPAVVVDGRLDEAVWDAAWTVTDWHQLVPDEGEPPTERTDVRVFHDEEALYVAARVHESDPSAIVERSFERNSYHRSEQDGIAVVLDTNNDQRTAFGFIVTPSGARTDVAVFDEARVGWNADWNAFWDAATARTEEGWTAEIRIPFSSLRFEPGPDGSVEMGMILWRYRARNGEFNVFPAIPNNWGNAAYKPGQAAPVRFHGVRAERPLQLKPYVLGGLEQRPRLTEAGDGYIRHSDPSYDVGADLQVNLTSNLVLDITANTDFAQVEADDERFNLDRFSLFFPEKRDFFQERSDLFNFRLPGGADRLFQSRRIGIVDGQPIPIHGGARLAGRHAGWELGLLTMQTASAQVGDREVPGESFGVARVQRPVLERGSYLGGMITSRTDLEDRHNLVWALDGDLHLGGNHFIGLQGGQSLEPDADARHSLLGTVVVQRRVARGYSFGASVGHVGRDFHPAVGFIRRTGTNRGGARNQYTWFPGTGSRIQNHSLIHRFEFVWDQRFRTLETRTTSLTWRFDFRNNSSARFVANHAREDLEEGFPVGEVFVPSGRHGFLDAEAHYSSPAGADLRFTGSLSGGGYFDGRRYGASGEIAWTPGPRLSLGLENVFNHIDVPAGRQEVLISRLRLGAALSPELTGSAFVQYNSTEEILTPNVRIRYNPREGNDLYLVYNEGIRTSLAPAEPGAPRLPRSGIRTIQLKYTHTFVR